MSTQTVSGRPCCRRQSGFTLIEVLVVVAIIALLVSILLPSLKSARVQARSLVCATNLKSTGHAFLYYIQAQKDFFPGAGSWPELIGPYVHKERRAGKMENLEKPIGSDEYLAKVESYLCPDDPEYITSGMIWKPGPDGSLVRAMYALSYGMNSYVSYPMKDPMAARQGQNWSAYAVDPKITVGADGKTRVFNNLNKVTKVARQSEIVLVTDTGQDDLYVTNGYVDLAWDFDVEADRPGNPRNPGMLEVHHRNSNNFLYADGHVEAKKVLKGNIFMEGVPIFPRHWIPLNGIIGHPPRN